MERAERLAYRGRRPPPRGWDVRQTRDDALDAESHATGDRGSMTGLLADTTVDLARIQFATTSLYHFLFVPLTLGLAPLVAVMQTLWVRSGDEAWLRLTKFFGTLMLINFAIGVATGLVQEFQFGMNWAVYSKYVGNIFGAPLAMEGLAAFFLESTFLGLWIFGWDRLSKRMHLATIWLAALGTWLSAYFILMANSWMQHPQGYKVVNGEAQLTSVWDLLTGKWGLWAFGHTMLAGLTVASVVIFGVSCWHLLRGRNQELFLRASKLALIVLVPVSAFNLWFGSNFGIVVTEEQPMKISSTEAQWDTCQPCSFSLFQIGGFTVDDQTPSFSIQIPRLLSFLATGSFNGKVQGMNELQKQEAASYGPGNYIPPVRATYWSMRIMAYLGSLVFLVAVVGAFLYRRRRLERTRWFLWTGVVTIAFPYMAALAGWVLTELGRQPWIVFGLLRTADAASPNVGTWWLGTSLTVFALLYGSLTIVDFVLLRRYARVDPEGGGPELREELPEPAVSY
jgi:cytochrome d ubiquinol oxidase subunit I